MLINVNRKQVNFIDGKVLAESSDLGLPPGKWPEFIAITDEEGEGFLFHKVRPIPHRDPEEFAGYTYTTQQGLVMEVFND